MAAPIILPSEMPFSVIELKPISITLIQIIKLENSSAEKPNFSTRLKIIKHFAKKNVPAVQKIASVMQSSIFPPNPLIVTTDVKKLAKSEINERKIGLETNFL